jgi:GTP cyclohydrolase I
MSDNDLEAPVRALLRRSTPIRSGKGSCARRNAWRARSRSSRAGYEQDPRAVIGTALFTEDYSEMILVKDIDFYSLCEHHILPFVGKAHVAYIPRSHIVGISKIARLVEVFARRLQVQERMTTQIAGTISELLNPLGVGVVLEAEHLCMRMRGVEKQNSVVVTSAMHGSFRDNRETRDEFMNLIARR